MINMTSNANLSLAILVLNSRKTIVWKYKKTVKTDLGKRLAHAYQQGLVVR